MRPPERFNQILRRLRQAHGLTQRDLSQQAFCSLDTVKKLESGSRHPSRHLAEQLASVFGLVDEERQAFLAQARTRPNGSVVAATTAPQPSDQHHLPVPLTRLIGREYELADVAHQLTRTRLLTLTGPGGSGKTRLALAVAAMHQHTFAHGVCFVDLAPITDASLVLCTVATALNLREESAQPLTRMLYDYLQNRHMLLVLDNFEHVLPAATLMVDWLAACPHLTLLVTSRTQLRVYGEQTYAVSPLAVPPRTTIAPGEHAHLHAAQVGQFPAVALFVERACAVRPDFALNDDNAEVVAEICRRLDGLPLALELAATRMSVLSVAQLATRLHAVFQVLTHGHRGAVPRQRTLRATVEWSYHLLSRSEQMLLRRLSIFAGGFTLEAVEGVCSGHGIAADTCLDLLANLVDASLVMVQESAGQMRYHLLETIRQYGAEQRREAHEADIDARHAAFFTDLACIAENWLTSSEKERWLRILKTEHDNLRAALHWLLAHDPAHGLVLAGSLNWFWFWQGYWSEGRGWIEQALAQSDAEDIRAARGKGLFGAGLLAWMQDDYTEARRYLEASEGVWSMLNDQRNLAFARIFCGGALSRLWQFPAAYVKLEDGLDIALRLGDPLLIGLAQMGLGEVSIGTGEPARGRMYLEKTVNFVRSIDDERMLAYTLMHLGQAHCALGEYTAAQPYFAESLTLHRRHGLRLGFGFALLGLAEVAASTGNYASASTYGRSAFLEFFALDLKRCMAESLEHLADWASLCGQPLPAAMLLGAAAALRVASSAPVSPLRQTMHQQTIVRLRSTVGADVFTTAWDAGQALSPAQLRAYVMTLPEADLVGADTTGRAIP